MGRKVEEQGSMENLKKNVFIFPKEKFSFLLDFY